ncbi:MAG: chemotaxis protein CheD [Sulfuricurvum sp.]|nr:chemotaxis protein CheD [Sulfuricurvum sp.]
MIQGCSTFIHVGQFHVDYAPAAISTILGSCVAVCLYDPILQLAGMNHYLLPLWNGNGLQSPKYGNICIPKLIDMMIAHGAKTHRMKAKIFGGASMSVGVLKDSMMIGEKNIIIARDILGEYNISIISQDVGGSKGRKIQLDCAHGVVLMKYVQQSSDK